LPSDLRAAQQLPPDGGSLGAHELSAVARELRRALDWTSATPESSSAATTRRATFGMIAIPA